MNIDNFIVRPKRRFIEIYSKADAWKDLTQERQHELAEHVAGLSSQFTEEDEEAKRFDLLILRLQLALLRADPRFTKLRVQVHDIAEALEVQSGIPMINAELDLIQELQTDEYWQDITAPMLEMVRKRLRNLIKLIEKTKRRIVYTDFVDEIGGQTAIELPGIGVGVDFERFKAKARHFLKNNSHLAIHKLRTNQPLTPTDLGELERMLMEAAGSAPENVTKARELGLGLFVRSLVGLERNVAKQAFADFLSGRTLTPNQIEFIDLVINYLTEHGAMEPDRLYESPFY
jgi:type I restriction enzyme R subunit